MSIYIPYFYVIQEVSTGMFYAGAKWGKDANPDNFMVEGGYTTSSDRIKKIIDTEGLHVFEIRKIKTFLTGDEAYDYETRFLQRINAASHPLFYNGHNNDGYFNIEIRKKRMVEKYGVEHAAQVPKFLEKIITKNKETLEERYGVKHNFFIPEVQEKIRKDNLEKYGVEHFFPNGGMEK